MHEIKLTTWTIGKKLDMKGYYHVYNKTVSGIKLFKDKNDYETFLTKFNDYLGKYIEVYAYVLMPNHFHFLIKVKNEQTILNISIIEQTKKSNELSKCEIHINDFMVDQFRRWLSSYSIIYKNKYNHDGSIFMRRFKRIESVGLNRNIYWLTYIHHNPIHHHYCTNYADWVYSSYNAYLSLNATKLCKKEVLNNWFSSNEDFLMYHEEFKLDKKNDIED